MPNINTHHRHDNHVLLLRHCVRSTKTTIKTCLFRRKEKHWVHNITEYISAPLPVWNTPPMWCTARGMDLIEQEGKYLIHEFFGNTSASGSTKKPTKVQLRFISDRSHRDADTAYSLSKGMMRVLHNNASEQLLTFRGADDDVMIHFAQELFKVEMKPDDDQSIGLDPLCPQGEDYSDDELSRQVTQRFSQLRPSDFGVPEIMDRLVSLGGLDPDFNHSLNTSSMPDQQCPGRVGVSFEVLKQIAEMAFYSRASAISPPFLPSATFHDVYHMLFVGDYVRSVEGLDNIRAAKGGVVLAKSMLAAVQQDDVDFDKNKNTDTATVTVYVGHDTDIDNLATALGLRWTLPPPFQYGNEPINHNIIRTPPGSGMIFSSSSADHFQDVYMSFVSAVNLMEEPNTTKVIHKLTPMFLFDDGVEQTEHGHYRTDPETGKAGIVTLDYLQARLQATLDRYPMLKSCYDKAPIIEGGNNGMTNKGTETTPSNAIDATVLTAWIVVNVILCACLFGMLNARRASSHTGQKNYEQVQVEAVKKCSDFELT